jgi:peptidoglycan/LPS O-acetylase OafA/YrhL
MVPYGWTSVELFFVLSGYLITAILIRHEGSPRLLRNFYVRRALRIWPIYYLTILVIAIAGPLLPRPTSWAGLGNRAFAVVTFIAFVTVVFAMARGVLPTFGRPPVGAAFSVLAINLLFAGFVGLVVTTARTPVVAWLRRPRLVHLGKISYGLYVYHFIVFLTLRIHGHPFLRVR